MEWVGWVNGQVNVCGWVTHAHVCMHAHTHAKHDNFNCKWLPQWRIDMCVFMLVFIGHPLTPHPTPIYPHLGVGHQITKNGITLKLIKIIQFRLESLKIYDMWRIPQYSLDMVFRRGFQLPLSIIIFKS